MLGTSRRRLANKLLRSLGRVLDLIEQGGLCNEARWITRTRSFNIPKKLGKKPRNIKSGEFLRSSAARRIVHRGAGDLRPALVSMRQWGVAIPNGSEALVHWRSTVEDAAKAGIIEPVVVADIDMETFFNSVEWPAIRDSLRKHFPEAARVVEWEQRHEGTMVLADGSEHSFIRGAEQGEPLGSVKAALPLGDARGRVRIDGQQPRGVCDEWYIDDGQVVCAPHMFDLWLRAFDAEIATIGAKRGVSEDIKSFARLVCPADRASEFAGWDNGYVRNSCKIGATNEAALALGAIIGDDTSVRRGGIETCTKIREKRSAISLLEHPASELILSRKCADVATVYGRV